MNFDVQYNIISLFSTNVFYNTTLLYSQSSKMNGKLILSFALYAVLSQSAFCGKIIENIQQDVHKAGENIQCAFRDIGNFLGIDKRGPCEKGTQQNVKPEVNIMQTGLGNINNGRSESVFGRDGIKDYTKYSETHSTSGNSLKPEAKTQHSTDTNIDGVSSPSTESADISSTKRFEMSGRRIISAHSNCAPGYVADSRGRCRERF